MVGKKENSTNHHGEVVSTQEEVKCNFEWYNFSWKLLLQFGSFSCHDETMKHEETLFSTFYLGFVMESFSESKNGTHDF